VQRDLKNRDNHIIETDVPVIVNSITPIPIISLFSNDTEVPENFLPLDQWVDYNNIYAFFDFDSGEITSSEGADIYLSVGCGSMCFINIIELSSSTSVYVGKDEPGFTGCKEKLLNPELNSGIGAEGTYTCIRTNENNIVQIKIVSSKAKSLNSKLEFQYIFWKNRGENGDEQ
jgi:hypothetical protein